MPPIAVSELPSNGHVVSETSILGPFLQQVRVPSQSDKVYNEEAVATFTRVTSPGGLYTSLHSFLSFAPARVALAAEKRGETIFLW
ncbi:MAG: hypothetical protein MHM6MM_008262 [Cercozoa sp. M6MM]